MKETEDAIKFGKNEGMKYLKYLWQEREKRFERGGLIGVNIPPHFEFKAIEKAFDIALPATAKHAIKHRTWRRPEEIDIKLKEAKVEGRAEALKEFKELKIDWDGLEYQGKPLPKKLMFQLAWFHLHIEEVFERKLKAQEKIL